MSVGVLPVKGKWHFVGPSFRRKNILYRSRIARVAHCCNVQSLRIRGCGGSTIPQTRSSSIACFRGDKSVSFVCLCRHRTSKQMSNTSCRYSLLVSHLYEFSCETPKTPESAWPPSAFDESRPERPRSATLVHALGCRWEWGRELSYPLNLGGPPSTHCSVDVPLLVRSLPRNQQHICKKRCQSFTSRCATLLKRIHTPSLRLTFDAIPATETQQADSYSF